MGKHAHSHRRTHRHAHRRSRKADKEAKTDPSQASTKPHSKDSVEKIDVEVKDQETKSKPPSLPREEWMTQPKEGWLSVKRPNNKQRDDDPTTPSEPISHGPGLYVPGKGDGQESSGKCTVGDGGAGWRLRALKRMQERSREEGRSLHHIAAERGMDLQTLEKESINTHRQRHHRHRFDDDDRPKMRRPQSSRSTFLRRQETEEIQKAAPLTVNKFPNDGSFMEMFEKMTQSGMSFLDRRRESILGGFVDMGKDDVVSSHAVRQKGTTSTMDNASVAEQLRKQLTSGQSMDAAPLPTVPSTGMRHTVKSSKHQSAVFESGRKRREVITDDANVSEMVKRTKIGDDRDIDDVLADNIVRRRRFNRHDLDADNEYDYDVGTDLFASKHRKHRKNKRTHERSNEKRNRKHRMETIQERCIYCFESRNMPKHLIISIATASYLRLPEMSPLSPGHCLIVPAEHLPTTREVEEHVWTEIRNFKKALILMQRSIQRDVIFLESAVRLRDQKRHSYVECIPVEHDVFQKAPIYFKKAIDDATEDWSQHHSKRCIDTSTKSLRGSIPEHFPYFHVEFNLHSGFVHVIDDEDGFDEDLGRKVLMGLMHLPPEDMYKRTNKPSIEEQKASVEEFLKQWHPYDWTQQL